jgi:hypothetical protein
VIGRALYAVDRLPALIAATDAPPGNVDDPPRHYRPTVGHYP